MANNQEITLSSLIEAAGDELRKARAKTVPDPVMQFTGCEIELDVKLGAEGGGGIKIWVLELGGKVSKEKSGTIKLTFGPVGQVIAAVASSDGVGPPAMRREGGK